MRKQGSGFFLKAITLFGIAVLALSACGGGGSDTVAPPAKPANLTAAAGDNQVVLNWSAVSGAATYNIYYDNVAGVTKSAPHKITGTVSAPRTVTNLTNGTQYFFAVSAVNAGGESALSVERSATPSATPPPDIPTNIRASAGDNQATVSWDSVAGATLYNIYYGTATGVSTASTKIADVTSPYVKTGLLNGTPYFFVVTAENGNGESGVSFEVSATPAATPPPAAPSLTNATAGNAKVTLAWGAVTGATSYNVYRGTSSGVTKISGTKFTGVSSPYDATGLTNGTPYFFVVTAVGAGGESAESNERSATPTAPAGAFSQADLTGTWKVSLLRTSSNAPDIGWSRFTGTADASGNLTNLSLEESDGNTTVPPGTMQWTIDGNGVVSESGSLGNDNVHMTMTSNKNFIAGTAGNGFQELRIAQKVVPGTVYSNADLASKVLVFHGLMAGADNSWNWQDGTTDASGMVSLSNDWSPSGNHGPQANAGTFSVNGSGIVTIDTVPWFKGFLSADKKTIVGVNTETKGASTYYNIMIIQITGQTYAASDLVGTSRDHMLGVGNPTFWAHDTLTVASGGVVTFSSYLDSFGSTTAPSAVTASITSSGTVTVAGNPSYHGTMSDDKKFIVSTQTNGTSSYSMSVMTQ